MTQHPEEGTLHAYIDGELSPAEVATLERHVGECARCAAALAEARGYVAAASRVITTLDAAPSSAATAAAAIVGVPSAPARRAVRPPIFRLPYARAAALLLLVGGTVVVVDRTGTFARGKSSQAESSMTDAATGSDLAPSATAEAAMATAPASAPAAAAAADRSTGAGGGITGNVTREAVGPRRAAARTATDSVRRTRSAERSAPATEPAPVAPEQRGIAGGVAIKDSTPAVLAAKNAVPAVAQPRALAAAPPPPPAVRGVMRLEEVVVTSAVAFGPTVSRYRTKDGTTVTLTEEALRASFAEESTAMRQSASPQVQQRRAAPMAAPTINSYRWSSAELGRTYTLSGPLTVAELEALSKRLSELERLP